MDEFSKRIRKEAADGTFSLSLTDWPYLSELTGMVSI
jgi:hypothetical protein